MVGHHRRTDGATQDLTYAAVANRLDWDATTSANAVYTIEAIVAEFYARIFYRNSVNGGYLVPFESNDRLCERVCTGDEVKIDLAASVLENLTTGEKWSLKPLGEVAPILEAGGLFPYARQVGMLKV